MEPLSLRSPRWDCFRIARGKAGKVIKDDTKVIQGLVTADHVTNVRSCRVKVNYVNLRCFDPPKITWDLDGPRFPASAPSMAAITTSRPVRTWPSVWRVTRFLRLEWGPMRSEDKLWKLRCSLTRTQHEPIVQCLWVPLSHRSSLSYLHLVMILESHRIATFPTRNSPQNFQRISRKGTIQGNTARLKPFSTRVWWVSARPISQGRPK